jgi:ParB family chromosome partitioning protein
MSQKKPVMGRGLEALLGQMSRRPEPAAAPAPTASGANAPAANPFPGDELANLPLDLLQRGKYQPRVDMRQESLQELADSIKAQGIVQPIVVRPVEGAVGASQRYEIIAGERRWRAAQIAGLATVPAVIRRVPDEAAIAMALIENIQRENLNPLEEARALERLITEFGITHQQAADAVGRSRAAVSNLLRLLELPDEALELIENGTLSEGHGRALLLAKDHTARRRLARGSAAEGWSVRVLEERARRADSEASGEGTGIVGAARRRRSVHPDQEAAATEIAEALSQALGADVGARPGPGGSYRAELTFASREEALALAHRLRATRAGR